MRNYVYRGSKPLKTISFNSNASIEIERVIFILKKRQIYAGKCRWWDERMVIADRQKKSVIYWAGYVSRHSSKILCRNRCRCNGDLKLSYMILLRWNCFGLLSFIVKRNLSRFRIVGVLFAKFPSFIIINCIEDNKTKTHPICECILDFVIVLFLWDHKNHFYLLCSCLLWCG